MDQIDRNILKALQEDSSGSIAEIAERANISQTPCWRRIKQMEKAGIITRRVALLDPKAVNVPLVGFVRIKTHEHNDEWLERFSRHVQSIPEIVEWHRLAGDIDYLLKIVAPDLAGYDAIYKRFIRLDGLTDVSTSLAMETLKHTTELPLNYAPID